MAEGCWLEFSWLLHVGVCNSSEGCGGLRILTALECLQLVVGLDWADEVGLASKLKGFRTRKCLRTKCGDWD